MEVSFRDEILAYMPWSYSKVSVARRCPFGFNRQYKDKIKVPYSENALAKKGRLVHEILEEALRGVDIATAYRKVCVAKNQLTSVEMEDCMAYRAGIETFMDRIAKFKEHTAVINDYVEVDVAIDLDFKPVGYWSKDPLPLIRGKIDYAMLAHNRNLAVIDHKSGGTPTKQYAGNQMLTYEILTYYGLDVEVSGVKTMLHYVNDSTILDFAPVTEEEITKTRKFDFINFLNSSVVDLKSDVAKKGKHCDWCAFKSRCPQYKK